MTETMGNLAITKNEKMVLEIIQSGLDDKGCYKLNQKELGKELGLSEHKMWRLMKDLMLRDLISKFTDASGTYVKFTITFKNRCLTKKAVPLEEKKEKA